MVQLPTGMIAVRFQRGGGLVLLGGWIGLGGASAALQNPVFPLAIERAWIETADSQANRPPLIRFTVRNHGDKAITAFGLRTEVRLADGTTNQTTSTLDMALSMREVDREGLLPGGRFTNDMGLVPPPTAVDVVATPALVVFQDNTAFGDETMISRIFATRAVHQRFWRLLQQILTDVTQRTSDPDTALRAIDANLEAAADPDVRKTAVYVEMTRRMSPGRMNLLKQSPRQVLQDLGRVAAAGVANADAHARRR